MATGRPIEYNESVVARAHEYISSAHDFRDEHGNMRVNLPKIEGLAIHLGVARSTLYEWAKTYPEFSDILERISVMQAARLIDRGLEGGYNHTIAKLLLGKHGYREGIDHTTDGGKIEGLAVEIIRRNETTTASDGSVRPELPKPREDNGKHRGDAKQ